MTWAEMTHPDDLAADVAQFNRVLAGEIDGYALDKRWICKDGRIIDSTISVQCLRRADGSVDYFVALLQDITERKQVEAALQRAHDDLGQRVHERTIQLTASNTALRKEIDERKHVQMELTCLKDELANDLEAMKRLHELSTRLLTAGGFPAVLEEILSATIDLQHADFGNIQLYNPHTQSLEIVAQRGFKQDFLDYFRVVTEDSSTCGRALQQERRVIIEDVERDPVFAPHRQIAAAAGFRAVQSTPLVSRSGALLGMLSTHFRDPHRPSERELRLTDLYARQVAEMIERKQDEDALQKAQAELAHITRVMMLGALIASIAHEVNQPLGAIVTHGQACLRLLDREPPDLPKSREVIERMINDGIRASDVITRIRPLLKKSDAEKALLTLNEIIQEVIALTSSELSTSGMHCRPPWPATSHWCWETGCNCSKCY